MDDIDIDPHFWDSFSSASTSGEETEPVRAVGRANRGNRNKSAPSFLGLASGPKKRGVSGRAPGAVTEPQAALWSATLNGPIALLESYMELWTPQFLARDFQYFIGAKETEARTHLQLFMISKNKKARASKVAADLKCKELHLEPSRCGSEFNINYCKKGKGKWDDIGKRWDDNFGVDAHVFIEFGDPNMDDGRKRKKTGDETWKETWDLIKADKIADITPQHLISHYGNITALLSDFGPKMYDRMQGKVFEDKRHIWLTGKSRSGKTFWARQQGEFYVKTHHPIWWDGYRKEQLIILDDIVEKDGEWLPQVANTWFDNYPFPAEKKHGSLIVGESGYRFIVTSNIPLDQFWLTHAPEMWEAQQNRFVQKWFKDRTLYDENPEPLHF